jgi:AraC-like DNA-binding protein
VEQETMPEQPNNFAGTPEAVIRFEYGKNDALSDILQSIHLRGGEVARCAEADGDCREYPPGVRLLHIVERGGICVEFASGEEIELAGSDFILVAKGDRHTLRAIGDASWVTGEFLVDPLVADPLLAVLPAAVVIRAGTEGGNWLPMSLDLMLTEVTEPKPGSRVMISRLLDLLFIHGLRAWAANGRQANAGWLTAAMDPGLGPVLTAIHQAPERDWPVDELARIATLSRSAFAARFAALVGESPGAYVLRQRLDRAADLLLSSTEPINRIARRVGYASEAAFSRAFARAYGDSPRAWRSART